MNETLQAKPTQESVQNNAPISDHMDSADEHALKHGRETHHGFKIGQYLQTPPLFFTRDKWPLPLIDMYRGASCFLIAGGPSFAQLDSSKLNDPGILTFGLNNSPKSFRPKMWTCVDDPASFLKSIWLDPTIMKFSPISHTEKFLFDSELWQMMQTKVGDCPNVVYYKRNENFQLNQYLMEDTINWGNHTTLGGGRSVMLAALRIMFLLGIRRVFLLGVDFKMDEKNAYHFDQERSRSSIKGNNSTYQLLEERFTALRPILENAGMYVFNCNPASNLKAFPQMPFEEAYRIARSVIPLDLKNERTSGLYDRKANERQAKGKGQNPPPQTKKDKTCTNCNKKHLDQIIVQTNAARTALHEAKAKTAAMKALQANKSPQFNPDVLSELTRDEDKKRRVFRSLCKMRDQLTGAE